MASVIRIKRSAVAGNPSVLAQGEFAYSALADNGSNGGDRLYIGMGTETDGNAVDHVVVGGKFFTDRLDHAAGTLTASSALVVDSNKKIDDLLVDNIEINGNSITSTDTDGNINITPNGNGYVVIDGQKFPNALGTNGQVLKTDASGNLSWSDVGMGTSTFTIAGNTGTDQFVTGETLTISGSGALSSAVTDNAVTFSVTDASTSTKGVASFDSGNFSVTSGAVSVKDGGISNAKLANAKVTIGSTEVALGGTATTLAGLTSVTATNFTGLASSATVLATSRNFSISGAVTASAVGFDGSTNVALSVTAIDVGNAGVTGTLGVAHGGTGVTTSTGSGSLVLNDSPALAGTPTAPTASSGTNTTQLATTAFVQTAVDAARTGLDVKASVRAATTANITLSGTQTIDGVSVIAGDRVLVKDQSTASQNGIYVAAAGAWSRSADADSDAEVTPGMFCFVEEGTVNGDSGYVLSTNGVIVVGTTALTFAQFSGAGQITAGDGLTKSGTTLNVVGANGVVANADSVELTGQALALHNLASNGIVARTGAGAVAARTVTGTTDQISVTNGDGVSGNPTIAIAGTYAGQSSIATVGTITTGTWNATAIAAANGGTGLTSYTIGDLVYASGTSALSKLGVGTTGQFLTVSGGVPAWTDLTIDGGTYVAA